MFARGLLAVPLLLAVMHTGSAYAVSLDDVVQSARTDAAQRLGLPAASFELVSAQAVTWPDGSLGCPKPGMQYTQTLVPGYRIQVRAKGQLFDYHASRSGALVLCPASRSVDPAPDNRS